MNDHLEIWVIYERPKDFPNHFVVRKQVPVGDKIKYGYAIVANSLEEARLKIPFGLFKMMRHPDDDPVIVETWI